MACPYCPNQRLQYHDTQILIAELKRRKLGVYPLGLAVRIARAWPKIRKHQSLTLTKCLNQN